MEERHTRHSHGSYPRADTLHFYHAYHGMMIAAGRLLAAYPMHHNPDYGQEDEFRDWLSRHDVTRSDGRWLWDRRDPEPPESSEWIYRSKEDPNRRVITEGDFDEALRSNDWLNLWGNWAEADEKASS